MPKTIRLRLEPGTRIKIWIRNQTKNVHVAPEVVRGRRVRLLLIKAGEARFGGGSVWVRMPGSGQYWHAFRQEKVLEILDGRGKYLIRNLYLCRRCYTNTNKVVSHKPTAIAGREDMTMQCTVCGHERTQTV